MTITSDEFRRALREFPTGVTVITVLRDATSVHGMTANSFTSVSLEPIEILVCVYRSALTNAYIRDNKNFAVNVLADDQERHARYFARVEQSSEAAKSLGIEFQSSERGTPTLAGSLIQLDCTLANAVDAGDHTVFLAEVVGLTARPGPPLLFHGGQYKRFNDPVRNEVL